jgi:hypothetical protein
MSPRLHLEEWIARILTIEILSKQRKFRDSSTMSRSATITRYNRSIIPVLLFLHSLQKWRKLATTEKRHILIDSCASQTVYFQISDVYFDHEIMELNFLHCLLGFQVCMSMGMVFSPVPKLQYKYSSKRDAGEDLCIKSQCSQPPTLQPTPPKIYIFNWSTLIHCGPLKIIFS